MTTRKIYKKIAFYAALAITTAVNPTLIYAQQDTLTADTVATDTIPWPKSMQLRLDSIIAKAGMLQTSQMGFMVYDLTDDSVLYKRDHRQTLRPASTMKLITAITALDRLGADYSFRTAIRYTGQIIDSTRTLRGDIYCVGGMDPMIDKKELHSIALALREAGIDSIHGNVYADRSMRDDIMYGEGWCWDDNNPMLTALPYQRKDNFVDVLATVLEEDSVRLFGSTAIRPCPKGAATIYELTHPLSEVLRPMLKNSNNMYAECIYYQLGLTQGRPSTAKKSKAVEEALLKKMGMGDVIHRFADGSGLSLYNYVSAELEVAFLRYAHRNSSIFDTLYPTLPIAGVDGTIGDRMVGTAAASNVHAKTGTLSGISSLAGYLTAPNGHLLCFAIINQGVMKGIYAKNLQDRLCATMCEK